MKRRDKRDYRGDVVYLVWRHGGDPDQVDYDRVRDYYYDGRDQEEAASIELRIQQRRREEAEQRRREEAEQRRREEVAEE